MVWKWWVICLCSWKYLIIWLVICLNWLVWCSVWLSRDGWLRFCWRSIWWCMWCVLIRCFMIMYRNLRLSICVMFCRWVRWCLIVSCRCLGMCLVCIWLFFGFRVVNLRWSVRFMLFWYLGKCCWSFCVWLLCMNWCILRKVIMIKFFISCVVIWSLIIISWSLICVFILVILVLVVKCFGWVLYCWRIYWMLWL